MITLPKEPWRGGQICGHQTNVGGWSEGLAAYCGEFKKLNSPACEKHDRELREDNCIVERHTDRHIHGDLREENQT